MATKLTPVNPYALIATDEEDDDTTPDIYKVSISDLMEKSAKDADDALGLMAADLVERKKAIDEGGDESSLSAGREYVQLFNLYKTAKDELDAALEEIADLPEIDLSVNDEGEESDSDADSGEDEAAADGGEDADELNDLELVTAGLKKLASGGGDLKMTDTKPAKTMASPARIRTASLVQTVSGDGDVSNESTLGETVTDSAWASKVASFMASTRPGAQLDIGGWDTWEGTDRSKFIAGHDSASSYLEKTSRGFDGNHLDVDPKTAAPCEPGCIRRPIADCGNTADPLDIFTSYPCDRGSVKYFQGISLSEVDDSITVWDEAKQASYNAAYDTWKELVTDPGSEPQAIANAYATLQACMKHCARVSCQSAREGAVLPIAVCLEITNEVGYSNPEAVLAYRSAISRLMLRARNAQRRLLLQSFAHHYNVDACSDQYGGLGAAPVLFQIIQEVLSLGTIRDRLTEAGYVIGIDSGAFRKVRSDIAKADQTRSGFGTDDALVYTDGLPIVELLEGPMGGAVQHPYANIDLPPVGPQDPADVPALPAIPNNTWTLEIFRPADFDSISVPQVSLNATRGPSEAKQNIELNMFLETFEGLIKPGCNPNFSVAVTNWHDTGARSAAIEVASPCA